MEYLLQTYHLGSWILYGNIWIVLYLLFPVLEIFPGNCIGGDQAYFENEAVKIIKRRMDEVEVKPVEEFAEEHAHDHGRVARSSVKIEKVQE